MRMERKLLQVLLVMCSLLCSISMARALAQGYGTPLSAWDDLNSQSHSQVKYFDQQAIVCSGVRMEGTSQSFLLMPFQFA